MNIVKKLRLVFSVLAIIAMISPVTSSYPGATVSSFGYLAQAQEAETVSEDATSTSSESSDKVTICHATSSETNPDLRIVVDSHATGGHFDNSGTPKAGHEEDLLFPGEVDCPQPDPQPQIHTINGQKWNDLNGNAQIDTGEVGVAGVTIYINDIDPELHGGNDSIGLYHASTTTDSSGRYSFNQVPAGSYQICEIVPTGWTQTFPLNDTSNCYVISTLEELTSYNFGNQRAPFCGDAIKNTSEQCDDGNKVNYDGCTSSCQLEQEVMCREDQAQGWWGEYFDLPNNHPDVNLPGQDFPIDDNVHGDPLGDWAPWTADWYDDEYYRFSRVDANLNFGDDFFPMDVLGEEVNPAWDNHDFFFAAHWRAKVTAPASTTYAYSLTSDDDSWVYIDGVRFDDKDGIHPPATSGITQMPLTVGEHIIDVFYAERHPLGATMVLTLDERLTVMPAPKECAEDCHSPLDYNNTAGVLGPDGQLSLSDAVEFTKRYEAALGTSVGEAGFDVTVDIKIDGTINAADLFCAQPYYGNAGLYSCQLDCNNLCLNLLDYDRNYVIGLSDGVNFTNYYNNKTTTSTWDGATTTTRYLADLNGNDQVDYGDYTCSYDQLAQSIYQCPIACVAVCGDATVQPRLGEKCDDGNSTNGDGCSSSCQIETNQCEVPNPLDYNADFKLGLADAVLFAGFYSHDDLKADVNNNEVVDYGDYLCAQPYYSGQLAYSCSLACALYTPVCGDTHKDSGEQCDDGNVANGDGCNSSCQTEGGGGSGGGGDSGGRGGGYIAPRLTLAVTKTVTPAVIKPGGQVTYTVTITDTGNIIGSNIELKDTMPAGLTFADGSGSTKTWHWDTISPNQILTVSYLVNISASAVTGTYQNLAVVTSTQGVSGQAVTTVAVENPQVLGVDNTPPPVVIPPIIPKVEEKMKILGFEKLPDTSGAPDIWQIMLVLGALFSTVMIIRLSSKRVV